MWEGGLRMPPLPAVDTRVESEVLLPAGSLERNLSGPHCFEKPASPERLLPIARLHLLE